MKFNPMIECDLCKRKFTLQKDTLEEVPLLLKKTEEDIEVDHPAVVTFLTCPFCGKRYPVVVDDETTIPLLSKLQGILGRQHKQAEKGFTPSPDLERKRKQLSWKLDFKRQKLAEKYNGSSYQLEDGTREQLDYRYHVR